MQVQIPKGFIHPHYRLSTYLKLFMSQKNVFRLFLEFTLMKNLTIGTKVILKGHSSFDTIMIPSFISLDNPFKWIIMHRQNW